MQQTSEHPRRSNRGAAVLITLVLQAALAYYLYQQGTAPKPENAAPVKTEQVRVKPQTP